MQRTPLTDLNMDTFVVTSKRVWLLLIVCGHQRWVSISSDGISPLGKVWQVSPAIVASNTWGERDLVI